MDLHSKSELLNKMRELQDYISNWAISNSQSNPGAVMKLRSAKRELEKIKIELLDIRKKSMNKNEY